MGQSSCGACVRISESEQHEEKGATGSVSRRRRSEEDREIRCQVTDDSGNGRNCIFHAADVSYEGDLVGGQKHGAGVLMLTDGGRYEGEFCSDRKSGYGKYIYATGASYVGEWSDDLQHGQGDERWGTGCIYVGQFERGAKHGRGLFTWATGCSYDGQFEQNDMHGEGTYKWSDGRGYSGQWANNSMGPNGRMWWPDGRTYLGEFQDGRKHGEGELLWPDGACYSGQWLQGRQHGEAFWLLAGGLKRPSLWNDGKFVKWRGGPVANIVVNDSIREPEAEAEAEADNQDTFREVVAAPKDRRETQDSISSVSSSVAGKFPPPLPRWEEADGARVVRRPSSAAAAVRCLCSICSCLASPPWYRGRGDRTRQPVKSYDFPPRESVDD